MRLFCYLCLERHTNVTLSSTDDTFLSVHNKVYTYPNTRQLYCQSCKKYLFSHFPLLEYTTLDTTLVSLLTLYAIWATNSQPFRHLANLLIFWTIHFTPSESCFLVGLFALFLSFELWCWVKWHLKRVKQDLNSQPCWHTLKLLILRTVCPPLSQLYLLNLWK